jgi:hypothetical protein
MPVPDPVARRFRIPGTPRLVAWDAERGVFILEAPPRSLSHEQAETRDRYNALFLQGPPAPVRWGPSRTEHRRAAIARRLRATFKAAFQ